MKNYEETLQEIMNHPFFKKNPDNIYIFLKYIIGRIDIKNAGKRGNALTILENSDPDSEVDTPQWFNDELGIGWVIESTKGEIDLKIQMLNDGELTIYLRGYDFRDINNKRVPIYIDYTKFIINDQCIFDSRVSVSEAKLYKYIKKDVKKDEIFDLHFEWEPFTADSVYKG